MHGLDRISDLDQIAGVGLSGIAHDPADRAREKSPRYVNDFRGPRRTSGRLLSLDYSLATALLPNAMKQGGTKPHIPVQGAWISIDFQSRGDRQGLDNTKRRELQTRLSQVRALPPLFWLS